MKYPVIMLAALFTLSVKANALSWNEFLAMPAKFIASFSSAPQEPAAPARTGEQSVVPLNIPPLEAKAYLENEKPVLIDIRTTDEYAAGHLENSAQMDYYAPEFRALFIIFLWTPPNKLGHLSAVIPVPPADEPI